MSQIDDQITNEMIQIVNENAEMYSIAEYIITKCDKINIEEAKEYAKYLTKTLNFKKSEIISGKADKAIQSWIRGIMLAKNSVQKQDEKPVETPLKTKKENVSAANFKKRIILFVAGATIVVFVVVTLVSGIVKHVQTWQDNYNLESSISQNIGMLASETGSDAYEYKMNIVAQNTYAVPGSFNPDGSPTIAYRNEDIAADIIKVCSHDPELFDVCVQNAYFNMSDNRLGNMDEVLSWLKTYTKDKDSLEYIYSQIKDCDIFVEYLVNKGFIGPNDEKFPLLEKAIKEYKSLQEYRAPFTYLPKEYQDVIQKLVDEYEKNKSITYPIFEARLKELVELNRLSGGRHGS